MSMYEETKKVIEGCNELIKIAIDQMEFDDLLESDENTIKAMIAVCKLYKQSKDLALKQAELMDKLERQNDELLEKVNVLLARTKAIQESGDPSGSPILFFLIQVKQFLIQVRFIDIFRTQVTEIDSIMQM